MSTLSISETLRRIRMDNELLLATVDHVSLESMTARFETTAGPLGDFCESLHDLLAHVLMWDEINLAVLTDNAAGREHWSLDSRWEDPEVGRQLNRAGVAAGRHLPYGLLLHRYRMVHQAVVQEIGRYSGDSWSEDVGALAQYVWTVPGQPAFWHAAIHLNQLPSAA